jgi:hypothetical protein
MCFPLCKLFWLSTCHVSQSSKYGNMLEEQTASIRQIKLTGHRILDRKDMFTIGTYTSSLSLWGFTHIRSIRVTKWQKRVMVHIKRVAVVQDSRVPHFLKERCAGEWSHARWCHWRWVTYSSHMCANFEAYERKWSRQRAYFNLLSRHFSRECENLCQDWVRWQGFVSNTRSTNRATTMPT